MSVTAVAGAPIRLVSLLRKHTEHEVRLIDLKRGHLFDQDLVYGEAKEESLELIGAANILHFHNHIDFEALFPIRLKDLRGRGVKIVRHFHSDLTTVSKISGKSAEEILAVDIPTTVIAQYPERYYRHARVVPNVLWTEHPDYMPSSDRPIVDVLYSPSIARSAWSSRWGTKGAPETTRMLHAVRDAIGCRVEVIHNRPLREVLERKRRARIIIDDLVTGSYHLSGLEGLSQGKAVLTYLDNRTDLVLRQTLETDRHPFINVRLEDAGTVLTRLLQEPGLAEEIGSNSRTWIERYWSETSIVGHYLRVYEDLLQDETRIRRQDSLRVDGAPSRYYAIDLPDAILEARKERYFAGLTAYDRVVLWGERMLKRTRHALRSILPEGLLKRYRKRRAS